MTALWNDDIAPVDRPAPGRVDREVALVARQASVHRGAQALLEPLDLALETDRVVAISGASGAGKTTLLRLLAGLESPSAGSVEHRLTGAGHSPLVGFVPQDDIVHTELTVRSTLTYAAELRLPAATTPDERARHVAEVIDQLGLGPRAELRVGSLSGGQRKRVSIAVELLGRPDVLLLDEPTSGLDPAVASDVVSLLHEVASRGVAVAFTTHREADSEACDRSIVLAPGGRLLADSAPVPVPAGSDPAAGVGAAARGPGRLRQAMVLTRRTAEVMRRNRLTLAVLVGSPLLVTAMMATLFRPSSFSSTSGGGIGAVQLTFWLAFSGFFFGLTYGLLQVVVERPVLERERFAGLSLSAYVASKVLVLTPVLFTVSTVLVGTLQLLDRLPATDPGSVAGLLVTLTIESLAALALGLVASSAVRDPAQATLALPMLCFPQVLFAGAVVPVVEMTAAGEGISVLLANRWAFEALGRQLGLDELASLPAIATHAGAFAGSPLACWLALAAGAVTLLLVALLVLHRSTPAPAHSR